MIWIIYALISFAIYIFCLITNPFVLLFCSENGELPGFLKLWQTWDDSCDSEYFMDNVCPKFLNYNFHKHYEQKLIPIEGNRRRLISVNKNVKFTIKERIQRYFCRLWWLTRNCAYGFSYYWFSKDIDSWDVHIIYEDEYTRILWDLKTDAWMYKSTKPIIGKLRWEIFLGWKIKEDTIEPTRCMLANRIALRYE